MIIPVWLLWMFAPLFPWVLPVTLLGNLLIDTAVLFCTLLALGRRDKRRVMKRMWWRIWWRGFAADAAGVGWLLAALTLYEMGGRDAFWLLWLGPVMYNPFAHPIAFYGRWPPWPSPGCAFTSLTERSCGRRRP